MQGHACGTGLAGKSSLPTRQVANSLCLLLANAGGAKPASGDRARQGCDRGRIAIMTSRHSSPLPYADPLARLLDKSARLAHTRWIRGLAGPARILLTCSCRAIHQHERYAIPLCKRLLVCLSYTVTSNHAGRLSKTVTAVPTTFLQPPPLHVGAASSPLCRPQRYPGQRPLTSAGVAL